MRKTLHSVKDFGGDVVEIIGGSEKFKPVCQGVLTSVNFGRFSLGGM